MSTPPNPSSRPPKILFNKDGVSLFATTLPTSSAAAPGSDDANDDHNGIILTLTLHRHAEKNVINPTMISLLLQALDIIDSHPMLVNTHNKALILTGITLDENEPASKFFSNGLDLEWMLHSNNNAGVKVDVKNPSTSQMIERFNSQILARILTLPFRTIAAINGHCIGAGLFLALACDYRIMRTKRGFLQWPEARLGMRLSKGFAELTKAKITNHHVLREGIFTAKMYNSTEAASSCIIDAEYPLGELYERAFQIAKEGLPESREGLNLEYFDPKGYTEMKMEMYTDAYRALTFGKVEDLPSSRI